MTGLPRPHLLPRCPDVPTHVLAQTRQDFERFASEGLPADLEVYLRAAYGIDCAGSYAGRLLKNPWGLASGQLSMRVGQISEAIDSGLGLIVLKTVIAEDAKGDRSMAEWAIRASRMTAERIVGRESGVEGWTVSWRGRGWWDSLDAYLELVRVATALGTQHGVPAIPSVKFHLPRSHEEAWRTDEYAETTSRLGRAFTDGGGTGPLILEKDFSPTLAGSDRSNVRATIFDWLARVPALIRSHGSTPVLIGLKLFNALFDDEFQLEMLRRAHGSNCADYLVYANRLFDPDRVYDGLSGVAYGGPDLSDRNLRVLTAFRAPLGTAPECEKPIEISATGDISSGRLAVEYALRGCTSFQIHTLFQLPSEAYPMKRGSKIQRALHLLLFDPQDGFVVWLLHAARRLDVAPRLLDIARIGKQPRPGEWRSLSE
jgi:dihydroorotate dehydrogenase